MAPPLEVNTKKTVGPVFVGHTLNWLLLGALAIQLYIYMNNRTKKADPIWIRCLVYAVFLLDLTQTVIATHATWFYAIDSWGNSEVLVTTIPWSAATVPIFGSIVALMVQSFYAWRIWTLARIPYFRYVVVPIILVSMMQCGAAIASCGIIYVYHGSTASLLVIPPSIDVWLAGSFVDDILIAACMITLLYQARAQTPWIQSQSLYDRLIVNTVQTGLITALVAGADLFLWEHYKQDNFHLAPAYILGKLYSNSFLSTLNGRVFRTGNFSSTNGTSTGTSVSAGTDRMQIYVAQDRERQVDGGPVTRVPLSGKKTTTRSSEDGSTADWQQRVTELRRQRRSHF
ncbi:hypothetical protein PENSPDRAFT_510378 [Peniophora sp. CONT]|nr:hypothetical protein PENSPDRAFT_510378 [Peniophora sp. CONT]